MIPDTDWMASAKCQGVPLDVMFPNCRGHGSETAVAHAKAVCAGCPVRRECLEYALSFSGFEDMVGVFGGLTPGERRRLRRERRAA